MEEDDALEKGTAKRKRGRQFTNLFEKKISQNFGLSGKRLHVISTETMRTVANLE